MFFNKHLCLIADVGLTGKPKFLNELQTGTTGAFQKQAILENTSLDPTFQI